MTRRIIQKVKYFEDYHCGCVSEYTKFKKDLPGYCKTHGDDRRQVWPIPKEENPMTPDLTTMEAVSLLNMLIDAYGDPRIEYEQRLPIFDEVDRRLRRGAKCEAALAAAHVLRHPHAPTDRLLPRNSESP